ncbi:MAG: hypothetical protein KGJ23_08560 [Euryarchaeota archaeon]|nr:hypothetical protein [Euryarchaeota archaeon]MDE1836654.1 hypothetical protein [Euryarchaeota archaeon]MDE1880317.1 hypothetical protein [Euryarchaeota archaeon]MDE2044624.1 hypothetical protein [Thermoplasmata archaeon]
MTDKKHGAVATLTVGEWPRKEQRAMHLTDVREVQFAVKGQAGHAILTYREDHGPGVLVRLFHGKKEERIWFTPDGNLKVEEKHGP